MKIQCGKFDFLARYEGEMHPMFVIASFVCLFMDNGRVILDAGPNDADNILIGEVDLGTIKSGDTVESEFIVANGSHRDVVFDLVRTSCTCTKVSLTRRRLEADNASESILEISLKAPQIRVKSKVISEDEVYAEGVTIPVARICFLASVSRPLYVPQTSYSVSLSAEKTWSMQVPVEIDEAIDVRDFQISTSMKGVSAKLVDSNDSSIYIDWVESRPKGKGTNNGREKFKSGAETNCGEVVKCQGCKTVVGIHLCDSVKVKDWKIFSRILDEDSPACHAEAPQ